jgi:hypothetical protein
MIFDSAYFFHSMRDANRRIGWTFRSYFPPQLKGRLCRKQRPAGTHILTPGMALSIQSSLTGFSFSNASIAEGNSGSKTKAFP